jgi:hypothetical protein
MYWAAHWATKYGDRMLTLRRVVHEAVDAAQEFDRLLSQPHGLVNLAEIRLKGGGPPPHGLDFFHGRHGTGLTMSVMQHHIGTLTCELQGDFSADSRA